MLVNAWRKMASSFSNITSITACTNKLIDTIGRDVCLYHSWYSTNIRPTLERHYRLTLARYLGQYSTDISADTQLIVSVEMLVDISADTRPTSRLTLGQHSTDSVGLYLGRYSIDISTDTRSALDRECRSISRPILDQHSTDTRPTLSAGTRPTSPATLDYVGR